MTTCTNCGAVVVYTSQHLVGGAAPGWRCPRRMDIGPDCHDGKHPACDARGFDLVADTIIACACPCHTATTGGSS